jgi:xanthine dehydrogenase YagR molybdenum-binding subunit
MIQPGNTARIEHTAPGRYAVQIGAVDIGTGTWTALSQVAADILGCDADAIDLQIGDTDLPAASVEGGSSGFSSWGRAIYAAAGAFRKEHGSEPPVGAASTADAPENDQADRYGMYSFGAHFVEARVNRYTREIHASRMLDVFSIGRVVNPTTVRSR